MNDDDCACDSFRLFSVFNTIVWVGVSCKHRQHVGSVEVVCKNVKSTSMEDTGADNWYKFNLHIQNICAVKLMLSCWLYDSAQWGRNQKGIAVPAVNTETAMLYTRLAVCIAKIHTQCTWPTQMAICTWCCAYMYNCISAKD